MDLHQLNEERVHKQDWYRLIQTGIDDIGIDTQEVMYLERMVDGEKLKWGGIPGVHSKINMGAKSSFRQGHSPDSSSAGLFYPETKLSKLRSPWVCFQEISAHGLYTFCISPDVLVCITSFCFALQSFPLFCFVFCLFFENCDNALEHMSTIFHSLRLYVLQQLSNVACSPFVIHLQYSK